MTVHSIEAAEPAPLIEAPSVWSLVILRALQKKHIYEGTVPTKEIARRRARNRVARVSRRINRYVS